jgi:hypothetical protein
VIVGDGEGHHAFRFKIDLVFSEGSEDFRRDTWPASIADRHIRLRAAVAWQSNRGLPFYIFNSFPRFDGSGSLGFATSYAAIGSAEAARGATLSHPDRTFGASTF